LQNRTENQTEDIFYNSTPLVQRKQLLSWHDTGHKEQMTMTLQEKECNIYSMLLQQLLLSVIVGVVIVH